MNDLPALAALAVVLSLLWLSICAFASSGGWNALGRQFPRTADHRPEIEYGWQTAAVARWVPSNYSLCVTAGANADGLFLRVAVPFRPFHPPLFIPWAATEPTARRLWFGEAVELRFPDVPGVVVTLTKGTVERLARVARNAPDGMAGGSYL